MAPNVLIIIPAYNEEESIGRVLDQIISKTPYRDILVINDGSTDHTAEAAASRKVPVISLPFNLGIGAAVQTGYKYAERRGYDCAVRVDADGQHEAAQIPVLLAPILSGEADLVIGSRIMGKSPYLSSFPRRIGISILARLVSRLVRKTVTDTTSGFQAVNRRAMAVFSAQYPDDYPEVESIICAHRMGLRIRETGVTVRERQAGESSITALKSVYYIIKVIFAVMIELLRKPAGSGDAAGTSGQFHRRDA